MDRAFSHKLRKAMPHDEPLPQGRHPSEPACQKLYLDLHRKYIVALQEKRNTFGMHEYLVTEHLRMSGIYCLNPKP
jgi:hypothetical protein